jgi:hypothetical protein
VIRRRIDLAFATRAHHVAGAILVGAKKRTAFVNALFLCRFGGIEWRFRALRVSRAVACFGKLSENNRGDTNRCTIARRSQPCPRGPDTRCAQPRPGTAGLPGSRLPLNGAKRK